MSYCSTLFITLRKDYGSWVFGDKLAEVEMGAMGINGNLKYFKEVFKAPVDFDLNFTTLSSQVDVDPNATEKDFRSDRYGDHCHYASIDDVLKYLEDLVENSDKEEYVSWRVKPAIATLKAWKNDVTGLTVEPIVVHWGH